MLCLQQPKNHLEGIKVPLLHEIQESVVQEGADLGSILLKLRFLASRLGSDVLEEWVKHESEGYPKDVEVPSYRIVGVSYKGTFSGPFGSGIQRPPTPLTPRSEPRNISPSFLPRNLPGLEPSTATRREER